MTKKIIIISSLIILCFIHFIFIRNGIIFLKNHLSPSTPKGVDISPIYNIKLKEKFCDIDKLKNNIPRKVRYKVDERNNAFIAGSLNRSNDDHVYRYFTMFQFSTINEALGEYKSYKNMFTDRLYSWRLYKQEGNENDKYFISYKTTRFDYNHGIPCGINISPEILIGFLKNNLFIVVSYTGYANYDDYVNEINEDILYVSKLLKNGVK